MEGGWQLGGQVHYGVRRRPNHAALVQPRLDEPHGYGGETMQPTTAEAIGDELAAMRRARKELGGAWAYLTTREAVDLCPFEVSAESLLGYPDWICPRVARNPAAQRGTPLFWDPRDILALPLVLRQWETARREGREEEFEAERRRFLAERDRRALERIMTMDADGRAA